MSGVVLGTRLSELLERATLARENLRQKTETFNHVLASVEAFIVNLELGVRARVPMGVSLSSVPQDLVFGKAGNGWQLLVDEEADPRGGTPLKNASRETRLRAVDSLPALVVALIMTAESHARDVEEKTRAALEILRPPQ